jgi:hypothetical protein
MPNLDGRRARDCAARRPLFRCGGDKMKVASGPALDSLSRQRPWRSGYVFTPLVFHQIG